MFDLYIGNKNYSSWSLRPWLLMKHFGIPFVEHSVSLYRPGHTALLKSLSGNARVPCLHEDGFQIWESIAIMETLAERHPEIWPADARARARARSLSAEMHAGFAALRSAMPMNLKFELKGKSPALEVQQDIDRVIALWEETRCQFSGRQGPYLFGAFSAADAMYAPVACRFHIYNVALPPVAGHYRDALLAHPAMIEWREAALKESEACARYDQLAEDYGGRR
ncbi:MAG: Glutathione S-transferase YfcF [Betaproteobacteria bacterium ADurb.Bin341]|nr:MAG: Glutathione S-transferase YfcF [Betaproteobacteria bacterium ADurb.Bin341]